MLAITRRRDKRDSVIPACGAAMRENTAMAERFCRATMRIGDTALFGRLVFGYLVLYAVGGGAATVRAAGQGAAYFTW